MIQPGPKSITMNILQIKKMHVEFKVNACFKVNSAITSNSLRENLTSYNKSKFGTFDNAIEFVFKLAQYPFQLKIVTDPN